VAADHRGAACGGCRFSYLEPRRHISDGTALDGPEAANFGPVLARCARVRKEVTGAEPVYLYVFGGSVRHLQVHPAPHLPATSITRI
jgi:diadenosine tetraphosphate (Ap4A) HIT family hydrolase